MELAVLDIQTLTEEFNAQKKTIIDRMANLETVLKSSLQVKGMQTEALETQLHEKRAELEKSKEAQDQSQVLSIENERYEKTINDLNRQIRTMKLSMTEIKTRNSLLSDENEKLWTEIMKHKTAAESSNHEINKLKEENMKLEAINQILFNDRLKLREEAIVRELKFRTILEKRSASSQQAMLASVAE